MASCPQFSQPSRMRRPRRISAPNFKSMNDQTLRPPPPRGLPDLIHADDLPGPTALAWLQRCGRATLLDDDIAVGRPPVNSTYRRARIAAGLVPRRSTACGLLAFWVWEGGPLPRRLEVIRERLPTSRVPHDIQVVQRQLSADDSLTIAGLCLTSPLRTAADLACLPDDIFDEDVGDGRFIDLLRHNRLSIDDCREELKRNTRAVGYLTGRHRLDELDQRDDARLLLTPPVTAWDASNWPAPDAQTSERNQHADEHQRPSVRRPPARRPSVRPEESRPQRAPRHGHRARQKNAETVERASRSAALETGVAARNGAATGRAGRERPATNTPSSASALGREGHDGSVHAPARALADCA